MDIENHRSLNNLPAPMLSRRRRLILLAYLALSSGTALFAACEACIAEWRASSASAISAPAGQPFVSHDRPAIDVLTARMANAGSARLQTAAGPSDAHP